MSNLIKINYDNDRQTVGGRMLHEYLEVGTEYAKWITRMCEYGFIENVDFVVIVKNDENPQGGRPSTDHQLTIEMAKEICMLQRTEKGKQARQYFIELEKQWNSPEAVMSRALKMADAKLLKLQSKIEEDKPKVLFADSVSASSTSILIADLAKLIRQNGVHIGEIRLWAWMRENGYVIREPGQSWNMPTQRSMELGIMEIKEGTRVSPTLGSKITRTTMITGKGQKYFINKFLMKKEA